VKTSPIETLRNPSAPKPGDLVSFRPFNIRLDDVSYWRRYAEVSRWFGLDEESNRSLIGRVKAIKRVGDEFYYRISSGMMGFDAEPGDVILLPEEYFDK